MASKGNFELFCLGNPLLDIQGAGDQGLLDKYGFKANDAILAEPQHMGLYEELLNNHDAKLLPGGAAQNSARGAQYILPEETVVYVGCIGKDKYGDILSEASKKAGLRVEYRIDGEQPTGRCGVVVTGHNRSMCTDLAAANCYKLDHLKSPEIWKLVEQAKYYFIGGYHLTVCPPAIMALAEEAAAKNKPFALSIAAPFIPAVFKDALDATSPYWDYVVGNETEAAGWADVHGIPSSDLREVARKMAQLPKKNTKRDRVVIITQGTEPTIVAIGQPDKEIEIKEYPVHAIESSKIADTTGAGDAFAGGFMAGIVQDKPIATAIDMGQWLAKLSIQEDGPAYPFPKQTYSSSS